MATRAARLIRRLVVAAMAVMVPGLASAAVVMDETVDVVSRDGTQLSARLFKPDGPGPFAAVVMLHGCGGLLNPSGHLKSRETDWARRFVRLGWVVLLPDSFGPRGHGNICKLKDRPVLPSRERPFDAYGALQWLQAQPFVRPDKVALAGWSNGAMTALWTLKDDSKARPTDLAHDFVAGVAFYPGCIAVRKTEYKAKVPMLLQLGLADNWTLPQPCLALVEEANGRGGAKIEVDAYDDAVHGFDHQHSKLRTVKASSRSSPTGLREVRVGTNAAARKQAIARVSDYLGRALSE